MLEVQIGTIRNQFLTYQQSFDYALAVEDFQDVQGITFNPENGDLYLLDAGGPHIVRIAPTTDGVISQESLTDAEQIDILTIPFFDQFELQGLAYNPETNQFYVYSVNNGFVYAVNWNGSIVSSLDLSEMQITNFSGMAFAPSSDMTDSSTQMNLFIADSGTTTEDSEVTEFSLTEPVLLDEAINANLTATLVQIIDGSVWSPPNPDSSGLEYLIAENQLMISDSEVEEMTIYEGVNVFEPNNTGTLEDTCDTTYFSVEPSGAAANPDNGSRF
ncbi:MAG: hypothetical protein GWN30_01080, partial [Gammaproteobacteria bacterium]|nr:hypothetical protein [Gammaproteobacteria bacterium]